MHRTHDEDGDLIVLTDEDKAHIQEEITQADILLLSCRDTGIWRELMRLRLHLVAELTAGHRLPIEDDTSTWYDYEIIPRAPELGGGWRLRLLEDGQEVGGGVFPVVFDDSRIFGWWQGLDQAARTQWIQRAAQPTSADAYLAYLTDEAWHDATQAAGEWLDSRPTQ
jgi:hypothetical protein